MRTSIRALALLAAMSGGCKNSVSSSLNEFEAQGTASNSCKVLDASFAKYEPLYNNGLKEFAEQCKNEPKVAATDASDGDDATKVAATDQASGDLSSLALKQSSIDSAKIAPLPEGEITAMTGDCQSKHQYLASVRKQLEADQKQWKDLYCNDTRVDRENVELIDYPACRIGCSVNGNDCYTCRFSFSTEVVEGQPPEKKKGQLTCQTEADAKQGASEWCRLKGIKDCDVQAIECSKADAVQELKGSTGQTTGNKIEAANSFEIFFRARFRGQSPVASGDGKIGIKLGVTTKSTITIEASTRSPWLEQNGRRIGNDNSGFTCDIEESFMRAGAAEGSADYGVMVAGNGITGGIDVKGSIGVTNTKFGKSSRFSGDGKTEEDMKLQCRIWEKQYYETLFANNSEAYLNELYDGASDSLNTISPTGLYCTFKADAESGSKIAAVNFTFGKETTKVYLEEYRTFVFDSLAADNDGPTHTFNNSAIFPYRKDILQKSLSGDRLIQFMHDVYRPVSSGDGNWRVYQCWNK